MAGFSLIGYELGTYSRAIICSDCGKRIEAGHPVYGILRSGRSLSNRICWDCHDKHEKRAIAKLRKKAA